MSFSDLGLLPELLRAVQEKGYSAPTPIQAGTIPAILAGRDVLAGAQTGTGKTAAFVLPILQRLTQDAAHGTHPAPRALVLTPTRELAAQIADNATGYGHYLKVRSAVVFGGVGINPQIDQLRRGCDLLIATPGRLLDLSEQGALNLSRISCFVLDEADRMLDMGFIPDIRRIVALLPAQRQNLLFSATFSDDIKKLSGGILRNPVTIEVARRNATADLVRQVIYAVHKDRKRELLTHLIRTLPIPQAIVFMRTKHGANRLCTQLERDGINAAAIHSDKTQSHRTKSLADFKEGQVNILVATDIAARGLDVDQMPYVVNFELPHVPEDYVHRIGRTGRAGSPGNAISLVSAEESRELADIEKLIKTRIEVASVEGFDTPRAEPTQRSHPRSERTEETRAPRAPRAPQPQPEAESEAQADEAPVRRHAPPPRSSAASAHFSRPPVASLGKKPREVPALLGGLIKKTS